MRWHERLGYGKDQVALIVHADDAGFSEGHNLAIAECHSHGIVTSASVMIDWPWSEPFLKEQATDMADVGLHLAVDGHRIGDTAGIEGELERQFLKMSGFRTPTHMDSHGGVLFMSEVSVRTYAEFSKRSSVPALMCRSPDILNRYPDISSVIDEYPFPVLDNVFLSPNNLSLDDKLGWVLNKLGSLVPGIYEWIVHPSDQGEGCHDFWMLMQPQLKRLLRRRRFALTNWVEVCHRYGGR